MVCRHVKDAAQHDGVRGLLVGRFGKASPGDGAAFRLFRHVGFQLLLVRFNGEVVLLVEFLVAVHLHAGLVAQVRQRGGEIVLDAVGHVLLLVRQGVQDVLHFPFGDLDGVGASRVHEPAFPLHRVRPDASVQHVLLALVSLHQGVKAHDLCCAHGNVSLGKAEGVCLLFQVLHRSSPGDLRHFLLCLRHDGDVLVLRLAHRAEHLVSALPQPVEKCLWGQHVDVQGLVDLAHCLKVVCLVLLPDVVHFDGFRRRAHRLVFSRGKQLVGGRYACLHGLHRLPYRRQLLRVHLGKGDVFHLRHRIQIAHKVGVNDQVPAIQDILILCFQRPERLRALHGVALAVLVPLSVLVDGIKAFPVDGVQHGGHALAQLLRNVLLVAGPQQLFRKGGNVLFDAVAQHPRVLRLPAILLLGGEAVFQLRYLVCPSALLSLHGLLGSDLPVRNGLLQLPRLLVCKGRPGLRQLEERFHDVIRRAVHCLFHVYGEGIPLRAVIDVAHHVRNGGQHVHTVALLPVEEFRPALHQFGVYLVNVARLALLHVQPAEVFLPECFKVRNVPAVRLADRQRGLLQVCPKVLVFPVKLIVHRHGVFHDLPGDLPCPAPCLIAGQLVLPVAVVGNVVVEGRKVCTDLCRVYLCAVVLHDLPRLLLDALLVRGNGGAFLRLPLPVGNALFQGFRFLLQAGKLPGFFRAFQGKPCIIHAVDLGKAVRVVAGLVFQHPHTGLLQAVPQFLAAVVRDDGGQHFIKAHGPLGLGLKVAGGHFRRLLVDSLDVLGRLAADFVPLLGEGPHDSVHRPLALGRFHQDAADDVALDEGIVGMSLVSLLDLRDDAADLVINGLELCFMLGPLVHAQPPTVRLDFLDAAVFRRRHGLQGLGACAPGVAAALLLALLHRLDDVLQGVGIVELREAAEIAGGGVGVLAIVDARLAQQAVQLPGNPLLNGVVIHGAAQRVRGSHPVNFALGRAAVLVHIPCVVNDVLQGEDGNAVHGIVDAGLPSFVDLRVGPMPLDGHSAEHGFALFPVVVPENVADDLGILAQGVLHALAGLQVGLDFSQRVHAQAVNHLLQGVVTELVPHLVHLHRLQALALVCQIGRPHRVRGGQLLRQLCRAPGAGVVDAHRAQGSAVPEDAPGHGDIPGQPVQLVLHLGCLFAVHGVIYSRSCRRPGVAAVHLVGTE